MPYKRFELNLKKTVSQPWKITELPLSYTIIPPVTNKKSGNPEQLSFHLDHESPLIEVTEAEHNWLENLVSESKDSNNTLTTWSAFHSVNAKEQIPSLGAILPLLDDVAHSEAVIKHSIDIIISAVTYLNPGQTPVIAFDQPLFAIAKELQWKFPDEYGERKIVVMMGGLHIEMAMLKVLGQWLQGSGWVDVLVRANVTSSGTAESFLKASSVKKSRYAHEVTSAAMFILKNDAYVSYKNDNPTTAFDEEKWFLEMIDKSPQFKYWSIVSDLELLMLSFVRSIREQNISLYIKTLELFTPWFFAMDRINYARWVSVHIRDMKLLHETNPEVATFFKTGGFTVQKGPRKFSAIAIDQAHEQNNKIVKCDGGAIGLTENPNALRRWMLGGPELARVLNEFENKDSVDTNITDHHESSCSAQTRFRKNVNDFVVVLSELGNPFSHESCELVSPVSKMLASSEFVNKTLLNIESVGKQQYRQFMENRLIIQTLSVSDVIKKNKFPMFDFKPPKVSKSSNSVKTLKNDVHLFGRLYLACQNRNGDLEAFFSHENQLYPPSLSDDGYMRHGVKSDLLACLTETISRTTESPIFTASIFDGPVIVQMLKVSKCRTFQDYYQNIFLPYILRQLQNTQRLDIVWDVYKPNSLKQQTRQARGSGIRYVVTPSTPVPSQWQAFLRDDKNKEELFSYINSEILMTDTEKEIIVTSGDLAYSTDSSRDLKLISPCSHEEADIRILLHAFHAVQEGHESVMIRTVDTDVLVLAVGFYHEIKSKYLWVAFGTGKNFSFIPAHEIAEGLGPRKSVCLPMFHALTGCDTTSSFLGKGKKTAWAIWTKFDDLTEALLDIKNELRVNSKALGCIERFVILLYDKATSICDINEARKYLFTKKQRPLQSLPPTRESLVQHVRRAVLQGVFIWGQSLTSSPNIPDPEQWGWKLNEGVYQPLWNTSPEALVACKELLSCKCRVTCSQKCSCTRAELKCTILCLCDGDCYGMDSE